MQVVLDTLEYGSAIKKTPVVVGNCTGFAVNRVFFPYTQARCWAPACPAQGLLPLSFSEGWSLFADLHLHCAGKPTPAHEVQDSGYRHKVTMHLSF